jgi:redox-sensitive bicupin YhaK (pirin superfamily)
MVDAIDVVVVPKAKPLVPGFPVRRAIPTIQRRMVGPFAFLDQMGPTTLPIGAGLDVPPHPHIGLATITYLFTGEILHRDSLGSVQSIRPGDVNWMTAGRGIVHSERTPDDVRATESAVFGMQAWVALPTRDEQVDPSFSHHEQSALPELEGDGVRIRIIAGALGGARSPVQTRSELVYADVTLAPGARFATPREEELAIHVVDGAIDINERRFEASQLVILRSGATADVESLGGARMMLLGGARLDGPRFIDWNFVSSSRERIEQAKDDWRNQRFAMVPGETEFIPLPENRHTLVRYP